MFNSFFLKRIKKNGSPEAKFFIELLEKPCHEYSQPMKAANKVISISKPKHIMLVADGLTVYISHDSEQLFMPSKLENNVIYWLYSKKFKQIKKWYEDQKKLAEENELDKQREMTYNKILRAYRNE